MQPRFAHPRPSDRQLWMRGRDTRCSIGLCKLSGPTRRTRKRRFGDRGDLQLSGFKCDPVTLGHPRRGRLECPLTASSLETALQQPHPPTATTTSTCSTPSQVTSGVRPRLDSVDRSRRRLHRNMQHSEICDNPLACNYNFPTMWRRWMHRTAGLASCQHCPRFFGVLPKRCKPRLGGPSAQHGDMVRPRGHEYTDGFGATGHGRAWQYLANGTSTLKVGLGIVRRSILCM